MITSADLEAQLPALKAKQEQLWKRYQDAQAKVDPIRDEWMASYNAVNKLEEKIQWLKEFERGQQ